MLKANFKLFTRKTRFHYPKFRRSTPSIIQHNVTHTHSIEHDFTHPMVKKQQIIPELPDELIAEILKRLQVKYILRCMLVRKSWYHLIKSSVFIKLHLEHQKLTSHKYLFFESYADTLTVRYDDVQCEEYCKIEYLPGMPLYPFWYLSSHGLICVSRMFNYDDDLFDPSIYLWNPLVQKYKILPDSPLCRHNLSDGMWKALAFGFVPEVSDFVVVHVVQSFTDSASIGVYSLNTDSWKKACCNNVTISSISVNDVVFVNGAAYWLGLDLEEHDIVMCFDTKTDLLRIISLPDLVEYELGYQVIHPSGQSIAYFTEVFEDNEDEHYESEDDEHEDNESRFLDMWLLEYDLTSECSWTLKMRISPSEDIDRRVMGVNNNGEPILANGYNLISYDLDNHVAYDIVDSWNRWAPFSYYDLENDLDQPFSIVPFVENLVLLNSDPNN